MKKIIVITYILLMKCISIQAITISIKDFGAKGDGVTNDQLAFEKVSNYINQSKGNIILNIPYGKYVIGRQQQSKEWLLEGVPTINLTKCSNVKIVGIIKNKKNPILIYKNNLYFGSFIIDANKKYTPKCLPNANYYNKTTCAFIGSCFSFSNCNNISISNIEIDGNQQNTILGGMYGDKGYQLNHRGFYLMASDKISLTDIYVHDMCLDGIEVSGTSNVTLNNLKSNYNGRQGLSWVDGDNLTATNCSFNYTGTKRIFSAPGAGIDIEPEGNNNIKNGTFLNCEFKSNSGCGILNDRNKNLATNINFSNCTILGKYNWAIWAMGQKFKFDNCKIYGHIVNTIKNEDVKSIDDITYFNNCYFSNVYNNQLTKSVSSYLIDLNFSKIKIENSQIYAYNVGFLWHDNSDARKGLESQIINTKIRSNNSENYTASTSGIYFKNSDIAYTEKVHININGCSNNNNNIKSMKSLDINKEMKSSTISTFVDDRNNLFNCNN